MKTLRNLLALLFLLSCSFSFAAPHDLLVYVGTYTRQTSKGIYAYRFNESSGKSTSLGLVAETSNPSFLAVHPNGRFLYAVGEDTEGTVSAFAIDKATAKLKHLNSVSSKGSGPCHLAFDRTGKWLFVANYSNGSVASFPVHSDGSLGEAASSIQHSGSGPNPQRQSGPHAHSVNISRDNHFLIVTDLGLDEILVYRFDGITGGLTPNKIPFVKTEPGSGPRHFTFSPDGKFAWVLNELDATVTAMIYDHAGGTFTPLQTLSVVPRDFTGPRSAAEIAIHPNGRFLYTSNRGHDSIAIFEVDPAKGFMRPGAWISTGGKTPRSFAIDPMGEFLFVANQDSNNLFIYRIDTKTGSPVPTGNILEIPVPVSVVFVAPL